MFYKKILLRNNYLIVKFSEAYTNPVDNMVRKSGILSKNLKSCNETLLEGSDGTEGKSSYNSKSGDNGLLESAMIEETSVASTTSYWYRVIAV